MKSSMELLDMLHRLNSWLGTVLVEIFGKDFGDKWRFFKAVLTRSNTGS